MLACPDEDLRLCRQGDANMGAGSARKGGACWRGPTEDKGFSGRATPTWAGARRDSGRPVGVARRKTKALPGGRRQHGRRQRGKGRALLAWPDGGLRLCGQDDANMGAGSAGKGGPWWRGPTEDKGFSGRATPTWAPAARERAGLGGVARRRIKALPAGRRQHGRRQVGKGRALLAWPDEGLRLCGQGDANMGAGNHSASGQRRKGGRCLRRMQNNQKKRAKSPHMNCDCSALYLLNCPADSTYRICLPSLPRRS